MLPDHIDALLDKRVYPFDVESVELVQTAISYVLLAGEHVYKLRKPVDLGYLDFTTLEKRLADCEAEVRLNTRGCPGLYQGVEAIVRHHGAYAIGGAGEIVDYAVHMRRLPEEGMMSRLLERDAVSLEMAGRLVQRLVEMHSGAERSARIAELGGVETLMANWRENFEQLEPFVGRTIAKRQFDRLKRFVDATFEREAPLMRRRVEEGWVRDCHGDLRSDSICFDPATPNGICLYDAIEFNERFRYMDTALDVAFLAMDLDFRGHSDLSDLIIGLYVAAIGDVELPLLLAFFKCYRAVVRGKIESFLIDEAEVSRVQKAEARRRAKAYFRLAETCMRSTKTKIPVFLVMGLSGSGKSVLAGALASRIAAVLLSTDVLRRELDSDARSAQQAVDAGRYAREARLRVYEELARRVESYLTKGRPLVLDGTFVEREQRRPVLDVLEQSHVPFVLVECVAPEEVIEARQRERADQAWTASEGRWEVYLAQKARYEPPDEVPVSRRIRVDTTTRLVEQIEAVRQKLSADR